MSENERLVGPFDEGDVMFKNASLKSSQRFSQGLMMMFIISNLVPNVFFEVLAERQEGLPRTMTSKSVSFRSSRVAGTRSLESMLTLL